jgi:hypothetical protein
MAAGRWRRGETDELRHSPSTNQNVTVPMNTVNRHTANKVLKDAGLPKAF